MSYQDFILPASWESALLNMDFADAETRCVADWINQNGLSDYDCIASETYGYENDHDATGFIGACDCNEYSFIHKSR